MPHERDAYNKQFQPHELAFNQISIINPNADRDENLANLLNSRVKKDDLLEITKYLKENFSTIYPESVKVLSIKVKNITKADLYNQLIDFVIYSMPSHCLKCDENFSPYSPDNSAEDDGEVRCFNCKVPAHQKCYKMEDVTLHLVYLCQSCLEEKKETPIREKAVSDSVRPDKPDTGESESENSSDEEDENQWVLKKKKSRKSKETPIKRHTKDTICPLLIEGKCPHGISGKECDYKHKNICYKYCSFGSQDMHRGGCRFGEDCTYLHPTLCKNSVIMKTCLNENCTYAHLRYTKRKQQIGEEEYNTRMKPKPQRENYRREGFSQQRTQRRPEITDYQKMESNQPNFRFNQRNVGNVESEQHEQPHDQHHFLYQMMEKMQKQLLSQLQREMQLQFQQYHRTEYHRTEYPNLPNPENPAWDQHHTDQW